VNFKNQVKQILDFKKVRGFRSREMKTLMPRQVDFREIANALFDSDQLW